ncbi:TolB family protein [Wenzhouxiangella limi]|uniref:Uncharacterized protein n=1 Tax=Wenzhouxiangella limi TaxID=2707351 RepID=A0A845V6B3_9GAMM|nr:PD40 domain-containing protein [Wenzhouxiangella limi]NDY95505.1 hypothetical protein [Wenzhouxiangella limi]
MPAPRELPARAAFRISVDDQSETEVVPALAGAFRSFGGVLPDNQRIVFASTERNGLDFDIYIRDLESDEQRMLYEGEFAFWPRSISPDGKSLLMTQAVGSIGTITTLFRVFQRYPVPCQLDV